MLRFRPPVEGTRPDRFRPPHCPWSDCRAHSDPKAFRYRGHGSYRRLRDPLRRNPRFLCLACDRTFARDAFACTYYMKRPELLHQVARLLVAGSAHRQIAKVLGCAHSTVGRIAARLGRHALLFQAAALDHVDEIREPVVLDHFETFVFSQDDRLAIANAVGQDSWFVYGFEGSSHRRAGKRSARKRTPKGPLPEVLPGSVVRSTRRILDSLRAKSPRGLRFVSDDQPAYRAAVASLPASYRIEHRIFPNPPRDPEADRELARQRDREMFAVDLLHRLWRHTEAHHRRETIAFARRSAGALERAAHYVVWRNFVKHVTERRPCRTTPAMRLGLVSRPLDWAEILSRRLFPKRVGLTASWTKIYRRGWTTPAVGRNRRHDLRHAY